MLHKLSQIDKLAGSKVDSKLESKGIKHFNANLPVLLKVLAKSQGNSYLLKLGNTTLQTTAHTKLEIGRSYYANMQRNHAGQIVISNLVQKPQIDTLLKNAPLKLQANDLRLLSSNPQAFTQELKEFLLTQLASAHKDDFKELATLALSLTQGVISLVVSQDGADHLVQLAPRPKRNRLEFYAIFPHLGPISGYIWQESSPAESSQQGTAKSQRVCAYFAVMNTRVKELLEEHSDELGLDSMQVASDKSPKELFPLSLSLVDMRT